MIFLGIRNCVLLVVKSGGRNDALDREFPFGLSKSDLYLGRPKASSFFSLHTMYMRSAIRPFMTHNDCRLVIAL